MCSKTSLRYVLQMITASHLLAKRRKSEVSDPLFVLSFLTLCRRPKWRT
jgi:hypothetical protein